jgi:hypothetical protein
MIDGSGRFLKESKRSFPSPLTSLYKLSGLTRMFPRSKIFARYHLGNLNENENSEVDVLAGAFMMIPKKIIDSLGGFDESFFMYGEDIDLSFRIQKAGYKNFYFAKTSVIHFKGESAKKGSLNYVRMFYKAMSIFVSKHYGGGKAKFFNLLIQGAILLRALLSATGRFIRWVGMPVVDAALILLSFWLVKFLWNTYVKQEVNYSPNMLIIAFPVFTLIFLAAAYFSGLYDTEYKQSRLNRSAATAILVLLAGYALLPESLRFSRGILVFGSLMAYGLMTLMRRILVSTKVLDSVDEDDERMKTIIVGTSDEYKRVFKLMQLAGIEDRILGRVEVIDKDEINSIGNIEQLPQLLNIYPIKEVILCEGTLSFFKIIELVKKIPPHIRTKFRASCSESIIGSESKNTTGRYINKHSVFKLALRVNKRNKELEDIIISLIFIISFPVHLALQKNPGRFFKNVSTVLLRYKTWVGYSTKSADLPQLKEGVLSVTGVPGFMNTLPKESLVQADTWYAANYSLWQDVRMVWKSYKYLSV